MPRITGGCLCGAVRYSIDGEPIPDRQFLCHCVDCQKHTGTAFVSGIAFPADSVVVTGPMTTFTMPGGQSGEPMNRRFCNRCGSPILIDKDGTGRKLIMAGTLDDKSLFKPKTSLFCEQAPSWVVMPADTENLPRYYTQRPPSSMTYRALAFALTFGGRKRLRQGDELMARITADHPARIAQRGV